MGKSTRVDLRIIEFRERVLEAAGRLFDERGVEATKLVDICEAADVAMRTLSNHFPTKGDIVRALAEESIQARLALFDAARSEGTTTRERLTILFARLRALPSVHITAQQRELLGAFFRTDGRGAGSDGRMTAAMVELLEAGKRSELPRGCSSETFAEIVLGTICCITLEWIRREDYDVDLHLAEASKFLIGLLRD